MKTNRLYYSFLVIAILSFFAGISSCSHDKTPILLVSTPDGTEFLETGGSLNIDVKSDGEWSFSVDMNDEDTNWLNWNFSSAKGNQRIYFSATKNTTPNAREAKLTFTSKEDASFITEITLTQVGAIPILNVSPENASLSVFAGKQVELKIESNADWAVQTDQEWLKVSQTSGKGTESIFISGDDNEGNERNATITVSLPKFSLIKHIAVTQRGIDEAIYREPCTTWEAPKSDIKAFMSGYSIFEEYTNYLIYEGRYKENLISYVFDNDKLEQTVVSIPNTVTNRTALTSNIKENGFYTSKTTVDGFPTFVTSDRKTLAIIEDNDTYEAYYVRYKDLTHLFAEPYTNWGQSMIIVNDILQKRGYLLAIIEDNMLIYASKRLEEASRYSFNSFQQLQEVLLLFDPAIVGYNDICSYLESNLSYKYIDGGEDGAYYRSSNGKTIAVVIRPSDTPFINLFFISQNYWNSIINTRAGEANIGELTKRFMRPNASTYYYPNILIKN